LRDGSGVTIVVILNRILMLSLSVILARALGAEGLGVYAYAMAIVTLLSLLSMAGMPPMLVREIAAYNARKDWPFLKGLIGRSRVWVFIVSVAITSIATAGIWIFGDRFHSVQSQVLLLGFALAVIESLSKLNTAVLRGLRYIVSGVMLKSLARPLLATTVLLIFFLMYPELLTPKIVMAVQLVAGALGLFVSFVILKRAKPSPLSSVIAKFQTRTWIVSAFPFVMLGGVGFINKQTDILMLGVLATPEELGIYRIAVALSGMTLIGHQIVNTVIGPHIAHLSEKRDINILQKLAKRAAVLTLFTSVPIAGTLVIFGETLTELIYGKEFAPGYMALAILAGAEMLRSLFGAPGIFLNMMRHERYNLYATISFAVLNVVLNLALIPQFGILGAALATGIAIVGRGMLLRWRLARLTGLSSSIIDFGMVRKQEG
jgi:O-antigen/teichoic acid export membrane protein